MPKTQKINLQYHKHCHKKAFLSSLYCYPIAYACEPLCAIFVFILKSLYVNCPKICFLHSTLSKNSFATSIKLTLSTISFCTWSTIRWFILLSVVVDLRYVLTRFIVEKYLSLIAIAADITRRNFATFIISDIATFLDSQVLEIMLLDHRLWIFSIQTSKQSRLVAKDVVVLLDYTCRYHHYRFPIADLP